MALLLVLWAVPAAAHTVMIGGREYEFTSAGFHQTDVGEAEEFTAHLVSNGVEHHRDFVVCERDGRSVNCATGEP